jgi:hypothetical protein
VDPRAGLDDVMRKFLILPVLELQPLGRSARSQAVYRVRYPDSCITNLKQILFMKCAVLWTVRSCSLERASHFGRTYRCQLWGRIVSQVRNKRGRGASCMLLLVSCLDYSSTLKVKAARSCYMHVGLSLNCMALRYRRPVLFKVVAMSS